jgi:hypothetical protein
MEVCHRSDSNYRKALFVPARQVGQRLRRPGAVVARASCPGVDGDVGSPNPGKQLFRAFGNMLQRTVTECGADACKLDGRTGEQREYRESVVYLAV